MRSWIVRQYDDIKGNAKWAAIASVWWLVTKYGRKMLQLIPDIRQWSIDGILLILSLGVFFWLAKSGNKSSNRTNRSQDANVIDDTDYRTQYLEETQKRSKLQNEYAEAGNKILQLERVLSTRPDLPLTGLQVDAIRLSSDLLEYLKEIGPPPPPKYTRKDIDEMPSSKIKELWIAGDVDFAEACEYYNCGAAQTEQALYNQMIGKWKRLYPWYQKMEAGYALRFKERVEELRNRFMLEELTDDAFSLPIEYRDGAKNIRTVAATLWELAYKISEKGVIK